MSEPDKSGQQADTNRTEVDNNEPGRTGQNRAGPGNDYEMTIECPYCNGDGIQTDGEITIDCPECGGDGWY